MKTVILLRHGEVVNNIQNILMGGQLDSPLTRKGVKESLEIGQVLRAMTINLIFTSPNSRAVETLKLALPNRFAEAKVVEALREQDFGLMTGRRLDQISAEVNHHFFLDPYHFAHEEGESLCDLQKRVGNFFRRQLEVAEEETILLVCHANVIAAAVAYMKGLDLESVALKFVNAGLTGYSHRNGTYSALFVNRRF